MRAASSNGGFTWKEQMILVEEVGADFDGLSQLRALIASGRKAAVASEDIVAILGTSCRLGKTAHQANER